MIVTGKPTLPEARLLRAEIFRRDFQGCCLHIFLDDENTDLKHVQSCLVRAVKRDLQESGHLFCILLAEMALRMSRTQRRKLASGR